MDFYQNLYNKKLDRGIMMNLVMGATGMVGSEICKRLFSRGKRVRAMVRSISNQAKVANL